MKTLLLILAFTSIGAAQKLPDKFPTDYKGDDFFAVQRLLWPYDKLAKSEFETQAEFKQRKDTLLKEIQINGHSVTHTIFIITPYCSYTAEIKSFYCLSLKPEERVDAHRTDKPIWHKLRLFTTNTEVQFTQWNWAIDVETAKEAKPFLKVAVVGSPVNVVEDAIYFVPTQAVFFNQKTGEIYKNLKIGTVE